MATPNNSPEFKTECEARYWIQYAKNQAGDHWRTYLREFLTQIEDKRKSQQPDLRAAINRELGIKHDN